MVRSTTTLTLIGPLTYILETLDEDAMAGLATSAFLMCSLTLATRALGNRDSLDPAPAGPDHGWG
jgi:hypothetical protein